MVPCLVNHLTLVGLRCCWRRRSAQFKPVVQAYFLLPLTHFKGGRAQTPILLPRPPHDAKLSFISLPGSKLGVPVPPGSELVQVVCSEAESRRLLPLVSAPLPPRTALRGVRPGDERFPPVSLSPTQLAAAKQIWAAASASEKWLPPKFERVLGVFGWRCGVPAPACGEGMFEAVMQAFVDQRAPVVFAGDHMTGIGTLESALRSGLWAAGRLAGRMS